ncbi:hypothetical protein ACIBJC_00355 [Streptomyces sp. NPDC050509]|uniref:hypothetical protein n=1 Tax=Streptomyces sp. NPDC050509 TaxID=3365620 RepID=UPI0037AD0283
MTPISRRAFVVGSSGAALAVGSPVAWADRSRHRDVHGGLLDDAAMAWKRLPDSWQVPDAMRTDQGQTAGLRLVPGRR